MLRERKVVITLLSKLSMSARRAFERLGNSGVEKEEWVKTDGNFDDMSSTMSNGLVGALESYLFG